MNKKILAIAMVAIALTSGLSLSQSKKEACISDIVLSNVEALARSESSEEFYQHTGCRAVWESVSCSGKDGRTHSYAKRD